MSECSYTKEMNIQKFITYSLLYIQEYPYNAIDIAFSDDNRNVICTGKNV